MSSTVIGGNYWGGDNALSSLSCNNWKSDEMDKLPRNGIDMVTTDKEMLDQYLDKKVGGVDILKTSGRFDGHMYNRYTEDEIKNKNVRLMRQFGPLTASSFSSVYETNAIPFDQWLIVVPVTEEANLTEDSYQKFHDEYLQDEIWLSEKGKRLNRILLNCKSQCYDCHECERTFGVPDYDSSVNEIDAEERFARVN